MTNLYFIIQTVSGEDPRFTSVYDAGQVCYDFRQATIELSRVARRWAIEHPYWEIIRETSESVQFIGHEGKIWEFRIVRSLYQYDI